MREIKFRGKRMDNGEWVFGYYVKINTPLGNTHRIYTGEYEQDNPDYPIFYDVEEKSVGQFTGLYDATKWEELTNDEQASWLATKKTREEWKGKEIYENDIVRVYSNNDIQFIDIIEYQGSFFAPRYSCQTMETLLHIGVTFKVIGNITDTLKWWRQYETNYVS